MNQVKCEIAALKSTGQKSPGIPLITVYTPNSKKRKLEEAQAVENQEDLPCYASVAGISPLNQHQQGFKIQNMLRTDSNKFLALGNQNIFVMKLQRMTMKELQSLSFQLI